MPSPTSGYRTTQGDKIETFVFGSSVYKTVTRPDSWSEVFSRFSLTTPGFNNVAHRSGLPFNKYGFAATRITNWNGYYLEKNPSYTYSIVGVFGGFNEGPDGFTFFERASAIDEAIGTALGRAKDQTANWGENIGTGKQSVKMVATNMIRVLNAFRAARQGNMARAAAHLGVSPRGPGRVSAQSKAIANGWLELQYGWKPLLQDIYETTVKLQDRSRKKEPLSRVSATAHRQKNRTERSSIYQGEQTLTHEVKLTAKVILYFRLQNEDLRLAAQMGLTNPAALAWELLPFSFILDWLLPVGAYFSNLDATLGTVFVRGGTTVCEERRVKGFRFASSTSSTGTVMNVNMMGERQEFSVNRDPLFGFPAQKVPHFKNPVSGMHLANAMALLRQTRL